MWELCGIAVDEFAVVCGIIFSSCLVFGKVPAGGDFGLQSLITKQEIPSVFSPIINTFLFLLLRRTSVFYPGMYPSYVLQSDKTYPNLPQKVANNIKSRESSRRSEGRVAVAAVGQCCKRHNPMSENRSDNFSFHMSHNEWDSFPTLTFLRDEGVLYALSYGCGWEG